MSSDTLAPIEQSIIAAIEDAVHVQQFASLAKVIKTTRFRNNHQQILVAWNKQILVMDIKDDFGVPESIRAQQRVRKGSQ